AVRVPGAEVGFAYALSGVGGWSGGFARRDRRGREALTRPLVNLAKVVHQVPDGPVRAGRHGCRRVRGGERGEQRVCFAADDRLVLEGREVALGLIGHPAMVVRDTDRRRSTSAYARWSRPCSPPVRTSRRPPPARRRPPSSSALSARRTPRRTSAPAASGMPGRPRSPAGCTRSSTLAGPPWTPTAASRPLSAPPAG